MSNFKIDKEIKKSEKRIDEIRWELGNLRAELTSHIIFVEELLKMKELNEDKRIDIARERTQEEIKKTNGDLRKYYKLKEVK